MAIKSFSYAQGTIEYLVIIAVVVVLSLLVVFLILGQSDSGSKTIGVASKIAVKTSGISISEAVGSVDGNLFLNFVNNLGETITVTGLVIDGVDFNGLSEVVASGATRAFLIPEGFGCEGTSQVYIVLVEYVSAEGLPKSYDYGGIEIECTPTVNPIVSYIDVNIDGVCGGANNLVYGLLDDFPGQNSLCSVGTANPVSLLLENNYGASVFWGCDSNAGATSSCIASREVVPVGDCWNTSPSLSFHPICTCSDLNRVREHLDWNYALQTDVNCLESRDWNNGIGFAPIGTWGTGFSGNLDGRGFTISKLSMVFPSGNGNQQYIGLFGWMAGGSSVRDLVLEDVNIMGGCGVGGLAGGAGSAFGGPGVVVSRVKISGNVTGIYNSCTFSAGGIFGSMVNGLLSESSFSGTVSGTSSVGGLVGQFLSNNDNALYGGPRIINSYTEGNVSCLPGYYYTGGLVGQSGGMRSGLYISDSFSASNVSGNNSVGGLVGRLWMGEVSNSYSVGLVSGNASVGGFSGTNNGTISNSYFVDVDHNNGFGYLELDGPEAFYGVSHSHAVYSNWDFDGNWLARDGNYPILQWQAE
jgi:hypothetical protein